MSPIKVIDSTQAWFWRSTWQTGEREADADLLAGRVEMFKSGAALTDALQLITKPGTQPR